MKAVKKIPIFLLSMMLCFGIMTGSVFAASSKKDGLEVTLSTDKKTYSQSDQIVATLTVKNASENIINHISLENIIPEGYKLLDGSEAKKQVESLKVGESAKLTATFVSDAISSTNNSDSENSSSTSDASNVATGDNSNIVFWIIVCILACGGIIALVVIKKKSGKKFFSLFLCLTIIGTMSIGGLIPVNAEEYQGKSISVSENVTVGNKDVIISGIVKYDVSVNEDEEQINPTKPENPTEADEYYFNHSEVIEVIDEKESQNNLSEAEAIHVFEERGFNEYPVMCEYSTEGEYNEQAEAVDGSNTKHPMYETFYVSELGDVWTIYVINGDVFAYPASFNLQSDLAEAVIISESESLTSYDSETNKFYVTIPNESEIILKTVNRIDAETLNQLTSEEVSK